MASPLKSPARLTCLLLLLGCSLLHAEGTYYLPGLGADQIAIDGEADDWSRLAAAPLFTEADFELYIREGVYLEQRAPVDPADASLRIWLAWRPRYLYGFVWRRDDVHVNQLDLSAGSNDPRYYRYRRANDAFVVHVDGDGSGPKWSTDACRRERQEYAERFGFAGKAVAALDWCENEEFSHELGQGYVMVPQAPDDRLAVLAGYDEFDLWAQRAPWVEAATTLRREGGAVVSTLEFRVAHWDWLLPRTRGPEDTPHTAWAAGDTVGVWLDAIDFDVEGSQEVQDWAARGLSMAALKGGAANRFILAPESPALAPAAVSPTAVRRAGWAAIKKSVRP